MWWFSPTATTALTSSIIGCLNHKICSRCIRCWRCQSIHSLLPRPWHFSRCMWWLSHIATTPLKSSKNSKSYNTSTTKFVQGGCGGFLTLLQLPWHLKKIQNHLIPQPQEVLALGECCSSQAWQQRSGHFSQQNHPKFNKLPAQSRTAGMVCNITFWLLRCQTLRIGSPGEVSDNVPFCLKNKQFLFTFFYTDVWH